MAKTIYDIDEQQAQLFFKMIDVIINELKHGCYKGKNWNDFKKFGITGQTLLTLKRNHYISYHGHKDCVWLSWKNYYYPDNTIVNLRWEYINICDYNIPPDGQEMDEEMIKYYYNAAEAAQLKKEEQELIDILNDL